RIDPCGEQSRGTRLDARVAGEGRAFSFAEGPARGRIPGAHRRLEIGLDEQRLSISGEADDAPNLAGQLSDSLAPPEIVKRDLVGANVHPVSRIRRVVEQRRGLPLRAKHDVAHGCWVPVGEPRRLQGVRRLIYDVSSELMLRDDSVVWPSDE